VLWGLIPQTITLAEVNARLNGEADGFRFVFELADEVSYTGRTFGAAELQNLLKVINAELKKLEDTLGKSHGPFTLVSARNGPRGWVNRDTLPPVIMTNL
jgi:hypothetical protein